VPRDPAAFDLRASLRVLADVTSYTARGHSSHSRRWGAAETDVDMTRKVCVVTGGSRGIGQGVVCGLVARGATVVVACRDVAVGEAVHGTFAPGRVAVERLDVSSLAEVRVFARRIGERYGRLDVLVNNAAATFARPERSVDGLELAFATNVLGAFVLTRELMPLLRATSPARVVHLGSSAQYLRRLDVDALLDPPRPYVGELVYAHTKRAVAELSRRWAERLAEHGVVSNCVNPGLARTPGVRRDYPVYHRLTGRMLRTIDQGADTALWLAVSRAGARHTGGFWFDRERQPEHVVPWTRARPEETDRLWAVCERLAG
jgi:NAD(P)-dependent dehydrogenase (short-subunit alcohol dehydrogenase family)